MWYYQQRMTDEGIQAAQRLIKQFPNRAEFHAMLADFYDQAGRVEDAFDARVRAKELAPPSGPSGRKQPGFPD